MQVKKVSLLCCLEKRFLVYSNTLNFPKLASFLLKTGIKF